jgi:exopolysaccharide biosynthesis predicted pyruvyltransferase EpsI
LDVPDFSLLRTLLAGLAASGTLRYQPNPGNAGDGLIASATWQLFERWGLLTKIEAATAPARDDVFLFGGGGNLVPSYPDARRALEAALAVEVGTFVLLPQTIRGHAELLDRLDGRFHLFCRDVASHDWVRQHAPRAQAYLTHDLALGLDARALLAQPPRRWPWIASWRRARRYAKWHRALSGIQPDATGTLTLMRADVESSQPGRWPKDQDLSSRYTSSFPSRAEADCVTGDFLRKLDGAKQVRSDRLHVCIGAALLGKRVTMVDNDYGKNRAVYDHSLSGRFPAVTFHASDAHAE